MNSKKVNYHQRVFQHLDMNNPGCLNCIHVNDLCNYHEITFDTFICIGILASHLEAIERPSSI